MKKIVAMVGTILGAVVAYSASVAWTITGVNGPTGEALGKGCAYVFFSQQSSGKADTSSWITLEGKGLDAFTLALADASFNYKHSDITADDGVWSYNSTTKKALNQTELGLSGNTKYSVYAIIFDTDTVTKDSKYMITTATNAAATFGDAAGTTKSFAIGNQVSASETWYNVPEPTSGLILLMGIVGLALKRKQV